MSTSRRDFLKSAAAFAVALAVPVGLATAAAKTVEPTPEIASSTGQFATGFAELDAALDGGFTPGTLNTFVGVAGCGKLNLANTIANRYYNFARHELNRGPFDPYIGFDYFILSRKPIPKSVTDELDRKAATLSKLRNPTPPGIEFYNARAAFVAHLQQTVRSENSDVFSLDRKESDSIAIVVAQIPRCYLHQAYEGGQVGPRILAFSSAVLIKVDDLGYDEDLRFRNSSLQIQKNRYGRRAEVAIARDLKDTERYTLTNASTGLRNLLV